jgi:hypothetical protein
MRGKAGNAVFEGVPVHLEHWKTGSSLSIHPSTIAVSQSVEKRGTKEAKVRRSNKKCHSHSKPER